MSILTDLNEGDGRSFWPEGGKWDWRLASLWLNSNITRRVTFLSALGGPSVRLDLPDQVEHAVLI
jgi:hypothetical protein